MDCIACGYKAWAYFGFVFFLVVLFCFWGFFCYLTPRNFVKSIYYISADYFRRPQSSLPANGANVIFLTYIMKSVGSIKKSVEKYFPGEDIDFFVEKIVGNAFISLLKYCYFKMLL